MINLVSCFNLFPEKVTLFGSPIFTPELIIAFIGILGLYTFSAYKRQRRSEAAIRALYLLNSFLDYVKEIKDRPHMYLFDKYSPDGIPEIGSEKHPKSHLERPVRLIFNAYAKLKKNLQEPIAQVGGVAGKEMLKLCSNLSGLVNSLGGAIHEQVDPKSELDNFTRPNINKAYEEMSKIKKEFEKVLEPFIEGHLNWFISRLSGPISKR